MSAGVHLANERTFLSWIRTSISVMAFGFVVVKFTLFIKQLSVVLGNKLILPGKGYSSVIGILLVGIGAVMALMSYLAYRRTDRQIIEGTYRASAVMPVFVTIGIILVSALMIYYLLPSLPEA